MKNINKYQPIIIIIIINNMAALMMASEIQDSHTVSIETAIEQLSKGQDYVCKGTGIDRQTGEPFEWAMLNDGHGTNTCINFIRSIRMEKKSELIGAAEPIQEIAKYIDNSRVIFPSDSTGATVVIVRYYKDRIECFNSGDSQFMVFKNNELFHISKEHNSSNLEERKRVIAKGCLFVPSTSIKMLSETEIASAATEYMVFPTDTRKLAPTQALGHNSRTGYLPEKLVIPLEEGMSYRVVMGSDGMFDMTMLENPDDVEYLKTRTCNEILNKAVGRWLQEWSGHMGDGIIQKFKWLRQHCDDVSVVVVDVLPK